MLNLIAEIQSTTRKKCLGRRPVFELYGEESEASLRMIESTGGFVTPPQLRQWLLTIGSGDLDQVLSIRSGWLKRLEVSPLRGHIIFAQDDLGNFYTIDPNSEEVHFLARSEYGYAKVASDFGSFMVELVARNYNISAWTDALLLQSYEPGT